MDYHRPIYDYFVGFYHLLVSKRVDFSHTLNFSSQDSSNGLIELSVRGNYDIVKNEFKFCGLTEVVINGEMYGPWLTEVIINSEKKKFEMCNASIDDLNMPINKFVLPSQ